MFITVCISAILIIVNIAERSALEIGDVNRQNLSTPGFPPSRRKTIPKFKHSTKSQADLIALLESRGWKEDQSSSNLWRWYKKPYRWALFTLRGAVSLEKSLTSQNQLRTMRRR
jgi:hypothetical protein